MAKAKKRTDGYYCKWYRGKQFLGRTIAEAEEKRDKYKYECEHGIEQIKSITVYDWTVKWLPASKAHVARRTYNQYTGLLDTLNETIGDCLLSAVTPYDVNCVWSKFAGKSHSQIQKAHFLYKALFDAAIENRLCTVNPFKAESAQPQKGRKGTHRELSPEEVRLIETVPHRCQAGAMFMLKAGLRRGEMLALEKSDIHDGRISISKAVFWDKNQPDLSETKNDTSVRSVPFFAPLTPFLDGIEKYVLPDHDGGMCSETAFKRAWESYMSALSTAYNGGIHKRWWHLTREWKKEHEKEYQHYLKLLAEGKKKEAEEYRLRGWRDISFRTHDCRHTFVTACRDKGVDIRTVIDWVGHSSEKMVLQIYDHPSASREQNMINLLYGESTIEKP